MAPVAGAAVGGPEVPEVDLAFHGDVSLYEGVVRVRFVPQNHGPMDVAGATVRLRWSVPLVDARPLPDACLRSGADTVLCRTGALDAGSVGEPVEIVVRVAGERGAPGGPDGPDGPGEVGEVGEVGVRIGTEWNGGATDPNPRNNEHAVLALDTGDAYYF
ncbi:hypothetical protein ACFWZ2_38935 [Streptomyces sp. NPDC059002]|uniref:hypothetical protein n=1 Tax=Streptomyces sp. NPDC059002 TaxID=3346690 RepID=UPI0036B4CC01